MKVLAAAPLGHPVTAIAVWMLAAFILLGALPAACNIYQFLLVMAHRWRDHYRHAGLVDPPRVVVLVPAWNEAAVLRFSIDRMMGLSYPPDRLRVVVVDDGSTDRTPEILAEKEIRYSGRVLGLRRENGGQGKAHTLNYGLDVILADDWAQAILITDADVVFEPTAIRRMVRHLADPNVGAVTAFIRETSKPPNWLNRYVGYEYCVAQAAARRAQNVVGAQACLAGGAQLHTRANLEALGGHIDTSTLAEDTVTTILTQLGGRTVVFDGSAQCLAEEPRDIAGLWKQRLRWSRGNVQVTRRFRKVFFHPSPVHKLGHLWIGLMWFSTLLLPAFMICAALALLALWALDADNAKLLFHLLWITTALGYVFTTIFALTIDRSILRGSWRHAIAFPGAISLVIMAWVLAPRPMHWLLHHAFNSAGIGWDHDVRLALQLSAYSWVALCMVGAWLTYRVDRSERAPILVPLLMFIVGYGPLLCAITFAAYVAEARGTAQVWDKTEKTGAVIGQ